MSRSHRLGFENMVRSAKHSDSERRRIGDRKPPPYEACCGAAPNLPTYSEAMADYYTIPRELPARGLFLFQENTNRNLLFLGPRPEVLRCPNCLVNVLTLVVRVPMSKLNIPKLFMYIMCCCLPFCCDCNERQMKKHYCPKCYNLIGIYKRSNRHRDINR